MQTRLLEISQFITLNVSSKIEPKYNIKHLIFASVTIIPTKICMKYILHTFLNVHILCAFSTHILENV